MQKKDILYKEIAARVGEGEMKGINNLLEAGHYGIAEKHAVQKFVTYVRDLESRLNMAVPSYDTIQQRKVVAATLKQGLVIRPLW